MRNLIIGLLLLVAGPPATGCERLPTELERVNCIYDEISEELDRQNP